MWCDVGTPPAPGHVDAIELVCLEHLDVGFTAAPQEIARREKEHLDHAIALCRERPDFRWTVESLWQLEQWLARTPDPQERAQLVSLVKEGRIEVTGGFANFHTATMDAELLLRSFEPADAIRRELGIEITSCVQDDVPGFCALFPKAMRDGGVRHLLAGVNTSFGGGTSLGPGKNPFWWEGLDGSRVLTWVAYGSYVEAEQLGLGVWSRDGEAEQKLAPALESLAKSGYAFDRVLVMAATGDNGDPDAARSILRKVDAWNATHATPHLGFTTPGAFLARLERDAIAATGKPDGGFPVARGDWSGHWEPVKAGAPAAMALYRDAQALLPGAEALSLRANRELGLPWPQHDLDAALRDLLLFAEHSQGGNVGWPKLTSKDEVDASNQFSYALAFRADETLRALVERATAAYSDKLAGDGAAAVVANPTPFARREAVELGDRRADALEVGAWALRRVPIAEFVKREPPARDDSSAPDALFAQSGRGFGSGTLAPIDRGRDGVRAIGSAGNAWSPWIELATDRAPDVEHDPVRLLERLQPFGPAPLAAPVALRFTTAAGVIAPDDFLPGGQPSAFCTTGAIELTTSAADGARRVATLLLREPFAFEPTAPRWIGPADLHEAGTLWIRLLERSVRGETRDRGVVEFLRVEPTLEERLAFHVDCTTSPESNARARADRDADLVRAAWAWRCSFVAHEFTPWFAAPPSEVGTKPLVSVSSPRLLVLSCRPARDDPRDLLVRVQEIGGEPLPDASVALSLPGLSEPMNVSLRPHEVATIRFAHRDGR